MYTTVGDKIRVWGDHDPKTIEQLENCISTGDVAVAALMSDGHFGYSQPIGGVVGYRDTVSPSGVGYDIACGNKAVRTNLTYGDIKHDLERIADEIASRVQFGIGKTTQDEATLTHPLFEDDRWNVLPGVADLRETARKQLGTVGSGNHYVDVFAEMQQRSPEDAEEEATNPGGWGWDDHAPIWIGVHFGSRGFGHKTATGFMNLARGGEFAGKPVKGEGKVDEAVLIPIASDLGQMYQTAMDLAGDYAYAGRDAVVNQVLEILGAETTYDVHNHHNFAWPERHGGEDLWVVRKGATPLWPGQESFIGGSMCDISVIVRGKGRIVGKDEYQIESAEQPASLFSTVHGAGRIMGRMEAKGKYHRKTGEMLREGKVTPEMFKEAVQGYGIHLRGAGLDESPFVYRKLGDVLANHSSTLDILHTLRPIVVAMAGADVFDPYKD